MKWVFSTIVLLSLAANIIYLLLSQGGAHLGCEVRELWGVYCPGCGGTRGIQALMQGDILAVFEYHFLLGFGLLLVFLFFGINIIYYRKNSTWWLPKLRALYAYLFLLMMLLFTLIRNTDTTLGRYLAP